MVLNKNTESLSARVQQIFAKEQKYTSGGFIPLEVFFVSGKGSILMAGNILCWVDVDGHEKIDFLSMFSAANLGQVHPKVTKAIQDAYSNSTILSLAARRDDV
ncbi:hypothetical protein PENARI_c005G11244 [Penicillium arizonense]|uniref:Ornithine aminotransferase n=1 Tax=Penicillium arizonense TaxID=1835702 RepID=A0A1F5LPM1_PENAI|nr:hypothetical protein PENARI_c005G11244 [Penicillium arizonense]OGE54970.1 hypothetical protein PENARI_c005G11244 [Penicillium arizonense]